MKHGLGQHQQQHTLCTLPLAENRIFWYLGSTNPPSSPFRIFVFLLKFTINGPIPKEYILKYCI